MAGRRRTGRGRHRLLRRRVPSGPVGVRLLMMQLLMLLWLAVGLLLRLLRIGLLLRLV